MNLNFESNQAPIDDKYLPIKNVVEFFLSIKESNESKAKSFLEGAMAIRAQEMNTHSESDILREFYLEQYPEN